MGVYGKGRWGVSFYVGRCVLREWVVRGGWLHGYFGEQGLPVGIQEWLEGLPPGCVDYLGGQFVPKWDSTNAEGELASARRRGRVALWGLVCEGGHHGEFQKTMGYLEHGY